MSDIKSRFYLTGLVLIILGSMFSSCNNVKRTSKGKPLVQRSPSALIKKNEKSNFNYEYLQLKMSVDLIDSSGAESFKSNIKMKRDSIIWMSISPALGIEALRVVMTKDSMKMYSKIPNNKFYYEGTFDEVLSKTGANLSFSMIQEVLVGNAVMLDKQDDKLLSAVDGQEYYIITKLHRRLKKVLGKDEKDIGYREDVKIDLNPLKYKRIKEKAKNDELVLKRFWMDPFGYKITRCEFNDYYHLRDLVLEYEQYEEHKDQIYPAIGRLRIDQADESWQEFNYKITKVKSGKKLDFKYVVPENYEKRLSL